MSDSKLTHLGFIQDTITRMAGNSFLVKGWSVSLIAAVFALADKEANQDYAYIVYLPILMFWGLDGFFLAQERQYRELYNEVAGLADDAINFSMDASKFREKESEDGQLLNSWGGCLFSNTLLFFHGALLLAALIVQFIIPNLGKCR